MIPAENNPVSHVAYDYPKCNMGTGYQEWSDYCSAIFNHNAQYKQITADMTRSTYPKQMLVRITKDGKPVQRATVNFWGSRAKNQYRRYCNRYPYFLSAHFEMLLTTAVSSQFIRPPTGSGTFA